MISKASIDGLIAQSDIVDIVSTFIEVKKNGSAFKAICPFHDEKTPSLVISPQKQIFHCFGCGKGGDVIKFIMEFERLSYPEAIEKLAQMTNYTLEYEAKGNHRVDTNILDKINSYYKQNLLENQRAYQYLLERGMQEKSIEKFGLGFAPELDTFMSYLRGNFFNLDECVELGILGKDKGYFPRFINRITFPIHSNTGRCIGFGGRTIDNHPAKYVNSPQSKVFNKSRLFYGADIARDAIYKKKEMIVCEGYMDVIMLHQGGFENAIATLGTALTPDHIPLLKKYDSRVILAYDGDKAGVDAAFRASLLLAKVGTQGGVVIFSDGLDPADMVVGKRGDELTSLFSKPKPFSEFVLDAIISRYDLTSPEQKNRGYEEAKAFLSTLSPFLAQEYKEYLSSILKISSSMIKLKSQPQQKSSKQKVIDQKGLAEGRLIKTLISKPTLIDNILNYDKTLQLFHHYKTELEELIKNGSDSEIFNGIKIDDSIEEFDEEDFIRQIQMLMIRGYEEEILEVKSNKNLENRQKMHIITKCRDKIEKLKKGEMDKYERLSNTTNTV